MHREDGGNENVPLLRDDQRAQTYMEGGGDELEPHRGSVENVEDAGERRPSGATVTCRVCDEQIELNGRDSQHVVKCSSCHEATPIRPAPAGKKWVFHTTMFSKMYVVSFELFFF
ncbi:hypothetical protein Y032_0332g2743 [Ancylostoma ceylanicum]|uniref:Phosphatidylinositol-4,5-bisphosphate 4-phosphatase n=1 Tax=Ancylostoma ceylanicum TaxID=53326 RepID=A0A016S044_9BILA|nr:hypothetical protein Y032_0332g2743 [Ancylostoma ceylanicum]